MTDYPAPIVPADHVEPVPRRIRAVLGGTTVLDTTRARYVWEHPAYPQYYVPLEDVLEGALRDEGAVESTSRGDAARHALAVGPTVRAGAALVLTNASVPELQGTVRFDWSALDAWYEEDELVFVHPRNPYTRVDAVRSTRQVRVESGGVVLAESTSPVMVFETGLPTRYYLNRTDVDFRHLVESDTVTACPYKGTTSRYWSTAIDGRIHPDVAWTYDFPTRDVLPIAGLVAFYNEKLDFFLDGVPLERPRTGFARAGR